MTTNISGFVTRAITTSVGRKTLTGYLLLFMLTVMITGCGADDLGGNNSVNSGNTPDSGRTATPEELASIIAHPGHVIEVMVGEEATLDGSLSHSTRGQVLSFSWSFNAIPANSHAELLNATTATPSFVADASGTYMVKLVVSAGGVPGRHANTMVIAISNNERPPFFHHGLPSRCNQCHDGNTFRSGGEPIAAKSQDHLATSNLCEGCHTTFGFDIILYVDHRDAFGNCSSCHNGNIAIGKSIWHIETAVECDNCHDTTRFLELGPDGKFNHAKLSRVCSGCHNDIVAKGKHKTHLPTIGECNLCHSTADFEEVFFDHSGIRNECEFCHGVSATGKSADHPATSDECGLCHNTRTFSWDGANGFDHSTLDVTSATCESCHNNIIAGSKPRYHMPTEEDCHICHTPGTFATGVYDHAGVTGNCMSCHDGVITTGQPENHVPTSEECNTCHNNTETFANTPYDHTGIFADCASCHNDFITAGKTANHIPTLDDCSVCHNSTDTFASTTFFDNLHQNITVGCEGCHNSRILPAASKGASHIPTSQDCDSCHTSDIFVPSTFSHAGIAGNCISCHDGNHVLSGATAKISGHPSTVEDCGLCHRISSFAAADVFDHTGIMDNCASCHDGITTVNGMIPVGKHVGHVATTEDCNVCHVFGTFATAVFDHTRTIESCASCHDGSRATGISADHLPVTQDCSVCHNTTAFAAAKFSHRGIVDSCSQCHNGITAMGKHTSHVPTSSDCSLCHVTAGFLPATFDHTGIVDSCRSCHNGIFAQGKHALHMPTVQDCGVCHITTSFTEGVFNHTGIVSNCAVCHGVTATGKSANHLPTALDCSNCHTTTSFAGGSWDHRGITGNCASCHNGNPVTGKSPGHFITSQDCNICHSTLGWAPINFTHSANSNYPGDHNGNVGCRLCHTGNNQSISYSFPTYAGSCAACHANDYDAGEHNGTLSTNRNCGQSGCHRVNDRGW